jgi:galactose mutarotase-like enzyme
MVEIVTDYGGRVEILKLRSKTTGAMRDVLVGHNGDSSAIVSNQFWKGMLLLPWANRIAYVRPPLPY